MICIRDIYTAINRIAPFADSLDFDNTGLLVGDFAAPVHKVMVVLDVTAEIIKEAVSEKVELIISHHPVIFTPIKALHPDHMAYQLIQNQIAVLCCHTNLDASALCGTNTALGRKLGLRNIFRVETDTKDEILFMGELPNQENMSCFIKRVKNALQAEWVKYSMREKNLQHIAFCSGAGGDSIAAFQKCNADVFLTGELKYHEELDAVRAGLAVITAGHYETEVIFEEELISYLEKEIKGVCFLQAKAETPPMRMK